MNPGEIPANARGASASRGFWLLSEKLRERYRAGWWRACNRKPAQAHDFAYLLGYKESTLAHSVAVSVSVAP